MQDQLSNGRHSYSVSPLIPSGPKGLAGPALPLVAASSLFFLHLSGSQFAKAAHFVEEPASAFISFPLVFLALFRFLLCVIVISFLPLALGFARSSQSSSLSCEVGR